MTQFKWEEMFGFYVLKQSARQESPAFLQFLQCVRREHEKFSKSYFDASREDWTVRFGLLRAGMADGEQRHDPLGLEISCSDNNG